MTTRQILHACRERDTRGLTLVICANAETLADGYLESGDLDVRGVTRAATLADTDLHLSLGHLADVQHSRIYSDWHGGQYDRCGERVAGEPWGYRNGWVACPDRFVPNWCRDLVDRMNAAMVAEVMEQAEAHERRMAELDREEAAERTAEVIADCRAADGRK